MKHRNTLMTVLALAALNAHAQQRYLDEVFTPAQVTVSPDISYGVNIDLLTSDFSDQSVAGPEVIQLQTLVSTQQPIPAPFFDPTDNSTAVKVADLKMDIYQPDQAVDSETERPLAIYLHTGDCLPPVVNGVPYGWRKDSTAVEICKQLAQRGYVAASVSYRLGWNPLGSTLEERRGTLLNAVYRAIHDAKQAVRVLKADAGLWHIDPNKVSVLGEGMGGYIALSLATLDDPAELYIEKFRPDPFNPSVSYIDSALVGNLEGFNGQLTLYRPNGQDSEIHFVANLGGALPDTSWLEPGDVPMIAMHTIFNPFTPFGTGVVIVPATGEQVVEVFGSNTYMPLVNTYGNNASFNSLPGGDPHTDIARDRYGSTQVHTGSSVSIAVNAEGLYPIITPEWPAIVPGTFEEANPWQWWDQNSADAQVIVNPGPPPITTHEYALASNPNSSAAKGHAMIDTLMGYLNQRVVCALDLGPCSLTSIREGDPVSLGVDLFPNPATMNFTVTSEEADILGYELYDVNGRRVRADNLNSRRFVLERKDLPPGAYFMQLTFDQGNVVRKVMLD